jgi:predicted nucleic acid-binding protein
MRVYLDANVLFDSVDSSKTKNLLRRLKNAGHSLVISLSVLGEVFLICITEDRQEDLIAIRNTCAELKPDYVTPLKQSRICTLCMDKFDKRGYSLTDKTHLAYTLAHSALFDDGESYFLTTDRYLLDMRLPCVDPEFRCDLFEGKDIPMIVKEDTIREKI